MIKIIGYTMFIKVKFNNTQKNNNSKIIKIMIL